MTPERTSMRKVREVVRLKFVGGVPTNRLFIAEPRPIAYLAALMFVPAATVQRTGAAAARSPPRRSQGVIIGCTVPPPLATFGPTALAVFPLSAFGLAASFGALASASAPGFSTVRPARSAANSRCSSAWFLRVV